MKSSPLPKIRLHPLAETTSRANRYCVPTVPEADVGGMAKIGERPTLISAPAAAWRMMTHAASARP